MPIIPVSHQLSLVAHGVLFGPILGVPDCLGLVDLPQLSNVVCQRVVGVRRGEESLDRQENGANLQSRTPFVWNGRLEVQMLFLLCVTIIGDHIKIFLVEVTKFFPWELRKCHIR